MIVKLNIILRIFGYLRVILTSESTQKSTIRKHPFRHSFPKLVIVSYLRTFLLNHHLHCLRLLHQSSFLTVAVCVAVQCNAHCNTHCNAKIKHIIPKFYSRAVILLRSSFAMVDIIPKILVFSYVILLWSSAVQCKLQHTLMTSFQKLLRSSAVQYKLHCTLMTSFLNFCSGAVQCTENCNALCRQE